MAETSKGPQKPRRKHWINRQLIWKLMPWNLSLETKGGLVLTAGIALLLIRGLLAVFLNHDFSAREANLAAGCLRAGILLTVLGLAWDSVMKIPAWLLLVTPIICALLIFRPRIALFAVPILIALVGIKRWMDSIINRKKKRKKKKQ